jgi:hypothetical protein
MASQTDEIHASEPAPGDELAEPTWFRAPTRRERLIGAGLFVGFGIFFALLFVVQRGWWFRWVVLGLAILSVWHGVRYAVAARAPDRET